MPFWTDGSGLLNLELTSDEAHTGSHQGDCEEGVRFLLSEPHIKAQVDEWDAEDVRDNLKGYGAWDGTELADEEMNLVRTVWLACGDIVDNPEDYA